MVMDYFKTCFGHRTTT